MKPITIGKTFCSLLALSFMATSLPAQAENDAVPTPSATPSSTPTEQADRNVQFFCGKTYDSASGSQIPTTLVWQPEKEGNVALIRWKSEYFGKDTQKRCQIVSAKFQKLWNAGQLNFVTAGTVKKMPIVCGVANEGDPCNGQNQLFQLKPYADSSALISQLEGVFQGKVSSPVYESGGGNASTSRYLDVRSLLRNREVVSRQAPNRVR
jgi:Circadian oscillating protein COP23